VLTACGTSGSSGSGNSGSAATGAGSLSFRCATEGPVGNIAQVNLQKWSDLLKQKSGGKITMQVYPGGELMSDQAAVQALSANSLQCDASIPSWITQVAPDATILDAPFVFPSEAAFAGWNSPIAKALNAEMEKKNVLPLSSWSVGPVVFASNRPLTDAASFSGLRVRVSGSQPTVDAMKALGADSVTLSANDVATAVSTGTVDAIEGAEQYWASSFATTLKYAFVSNMFMTGFGVWVSESWFNGLPAATQQLLTSTLATVTAASGTTIDNLTKQAATKATSEGAVIHTATPAEESQLESSLSNVQQSILSSYPASIRSAVTATAGT
jgi:C4-dicarboxylate-binding protein DctP